MVFFEIVSAMNTFFRTVLLSIQPAPKHYSFLLPNVVTVQFIDELITQNIFPTLSELAPAITYSIFLSLARFLLQNYFVKPLAEWCMQIKEPIFVPIKDIDSHFPLKPKISFYEETLVLNYCKGSGRKLQDVQKYLRSRRRYDVIHRKIVKFVEALWRGLFYTAFSILGYMALFNPEPAVWILDSKNHWNNWPNHPISQSILFYYQIELGCYIHQLLWTEVNRSDSLEMIIHHIVTISLIVISYITNYVRVGSSILLLHDISDIFLEIAKLFNYIAQPKSNNWMRDYIVDPLFITFAITFFITRLVIYPFFILRSVFIEGYEAFGCGWGGCYAFVILLSILQILHIFWFYLIARMILMFLSKSIESDIRSDEEEIEDEEEDEKND